jgi:hypothetical protein
MHNLLLVHTLDEYPPHFALSLYHLQGEKYDILLKAKRHCGAVVCGPFSCISFDVNIDVI